MVNLGLTTVDEAVDLAAAAVELADGAADWTNLAIVESLGNAACTAFAGLLGGGLAAAASSVVGWR